MSSYQLIFIYFKTSDFQNNKFVLDFSDTHLVYQIKFLADSDCYITLMNCNLVIQNDYVELTKEIKELSQIARFLNKKGADVYFKDAIGKEKLIFAFWYPGQRLTPDLKSTYQQYSDNNE